MTNPNRKYVAAAALLLAVAVGFILMKPDSHLMHRAHKIGHLPGSADYFHPAPIWINSHEALFLEYVKAGDRFEFGHLDARTGQTYPLPELSRSLAASLHSITEIYNGNQVWHSSSIFQLSPDASHLLVYPSRYDPSGVKSTRYKLYDLDGSLTPRLKLEFDVRGGLRSMWMQGGTKLLLPETANRRMTGATVVDIASGNVIRMENPSNIPMQQWSPLYATSDNKIWGIETTRSYRNPTLGSRESEVVEWDVLGTSPPYIHTVKYPDDGFIHSISSAPSGRRVAWISHYSRPTWLSTIAHHLRASIPISYYHGVRIWTSDADGNNVSIISDDPATGPVMRVQSLQWMPGEQYLSFTVVDDVYSVPVERH